jgi:hypothetical protein
VARSTEVIVKAAQQRVNTTQRYRVSGVAGDIAVTGGPFE